MLKTTTESPVAADSASTGPEIRYLGRGVNVLKYDPFADSPPDKNQVVDLTTLPWEVIDEAQKLEHHTLVRQGFTEFASALAVEAGLQATFGDFSGSIDSKFDSTAKSDMKAFFARVQATCKTKTLSLGGVLTEHLTTDFRRQLETATPEQILDSFGTHVAVKVHYGGRCSYLVSSTASTELSDVEFEARAKAKYGPVSGGVSTRVKRSEKIEAAEQSTDLTVVGGDAISQPDEPEQFRAWLASVPGKPGFLGFAEDGLVPIWDLAGDRRDALRDAFRAQAARHPIIRIFQKTSAVDEWPEVSIDVPHDYKLLCGGAKVTWSVPGNHLVASYPSSDHTWTAQSRSHIDPSSATITVYAVALYDPDVWDLWDVHRVPSKPVQGTAPSATAALPDGYVLVGGGAHDRTLTGKGNHLRASYPDGNQWKAAGHDHSEPSTGEITAFAIGLRSKVPGIRVLPQTPSSQSETAAWPTAEQSVDRDYVLVGGGASCDWSGWGQILTASYPEEHCWAAASKEHLVSDPGHVTAYAIGIKVTTTE